MPPSSRCSPVGSAGVTKPNAFGGRPGWRVDWGHRRHRHSRRQPNPRACRDNHRAATPADRDAYPGGDGPAAARRPPPGGRCDIKTVAAKAGITRNGPDTTYAHLKDEFEAATTGYATRE